jgi:hypothetical protein
LSDKPDSKPTRPSLGEAGRARAESREARRAAALRTNLARRKAQSRARHNEVESDKVKDRADDSEA